MLARLTEPSKAAKRHCRSHEFIFLTLVMFSMCNTLSVGLETPESVYCSWNSIVKILLIVNESPWGSTLANLAMRFLEAAQEENMQVTGVFFLGDGVYNALPAEATDAGTRDLCEGWQEMAEKNDIDLMLCSAATARRLPRDATLLPLPFREAGLVEMISIMAACDRVVSF